MQRKIILVGEIVLDKNYIIKRQGKAAEFNSAKCILLKTKFDLGGAGMVYSPMPLLPDEPMDVFACHDGTGSAVTHGQWASESKSQ